MEERRGSMGGDMQGSQLVREGMGESAGVSEDDDMDMVGKRGR